jgi:hypothetical protein
MAHNAVFSGEKSSDVSEEHVTSIFRVEYAETTYLGYLLLALAHSSSPNIMTCSSETSVDFQWTTRPYKEPG